MATEMQGQEHQRLALQGRFMALKIVHSAMVSGVILFGVVVFALLRSRLNMAPAYLNPLCLAAGGWLLAATLTAAILHRILFAGFPADAGAAMRKYQVFFLVRAAVLESAALLAAVVALITANVLPLCLLALNAGVLAVYGPSQREFASLLRKIQAQPRN